MKEKATRKKGQQATREGKIKIRKTIGRRAELKTNVEKVFLLEHDPLEDEKGGIGT